MFHIWIFVAKPSTNNLFASTVETCSINFKWLFDFLAILKWLFDFYFYFFLKILDSSLFEEHKMIHYSSYIIGFLVVVWTSKNPLVKKIKVITVKLLQDYYETFENKLKLKSHTLLVDELILSAHPLAH